MHGLAVRQKDNPQAAALHLVNLRPKSDAAVGPDELSFRRGDDTLDPFVLN